MLQRSVSAEPEALRGESSPRKPSILRGFFSKFDTWIAIFAIAEAASVIAAAYVAKLVYFNLFFDQPQPTWPYLAPACILGFILYLFLKQAGLYDVSSINERVVSYGRLLGSLATAFLVLLGVLYVLKFADWYSRGWFLSWFALSGWTLVAVRIAAMRHVRRLVADGRLHQRVALYGTQEFVASMRAKVEIADPSVVIESFDIAKPAGMRVPDDLIDRSLDDLKAAIAGGQYDTVIIGFPASDAASIRSAVRELGSYSTELLLCTELDSYPVTVQGARNFGPLRTNVVNLVPLSERNRVLKSLTDYMIAAIALVLLSPFLALIALAIKIDSRGPVFFRQRRYGQNNRIFRIFKFRTMTVTEDGQNVEQAKRDDPRVTRVGWFLRRTSIDELPQLINVLTGDMSLVGPRPHALAHDMLFEQQQDLFAQRRRVLPGLTGWAQVNGYRGETRTAKDIRDRLQYDLYYIENWSVWFDFEIIVRTVFVLCRGAY